MAVAKRFSDVVEKRFFGFVVRGVERQDLFELIEDEDDVRGFSPDRKRLVTHS